jgi:hypothetical protein
MLPWKKRRGHPPADVTFKTLPSPAREASTLLAFIAGEFAGEIARLWPAPHTPFVLAPAARRHLVFLSLALQRGAEGWTAGAQFCGRALEAPLKTAIRELAPGAPPGLARALGRIGETAWTAQDYGLLLQRLADERTAKVLRHAPAIGAPHVRALSALPPALVEAGGAILRLSEDQCVLLAECYAGIERRDGARLAAEVGARWAQAPSAACVFKRVAHDLTPPAADPPHPGTERLRPIATREALADAAQRYRNCLEGRALDGWNHYYEWVGPPGAVVAIGRDHLFGWRLEEALGEGNTPIDEAQRPALEAELKGMGVHVGRSAWALQNLAREAERSAFALPPQAQAVAEAFGA